MKILILGDDINLFVAADAATFKGRHQVALGTVVMEDSTGWELRAPHITEVMSTVVPPANQFEFFTLTTKTIGTAEGWANKVADFRHTTEHFSWAGEERVIKSMDYFQDRLALYGSSLIGMKPSMFPAGIASADLIINTAQRFKVCQDEEHTITSLPFWWSDTMAVGQEDNTRHLNGDKAPGWYCAVKIGGHTLVKWRQKPPFDGVLEDFDMAKSNCTCALGGMVHVGPRAVWDCTQTAFDTFSDTTRVIMAKEEGKDV